MPTVTCPVDGTEFHIAPSHLARLNRPPTCSPECKGKAMTGKNHWHWRGGTYVDAEGYTRVWTPEGTQMLHRVKMEKKLGRKLRDSEIVRHKDNDRANNDLRNLELIATTTVRPTRRRRPAPEGRRPGDRRVARRAPRGGRARRSGRGAR